MNEPTVLTLVLHRLETIEDRMGAHSAEMRVGFAELAKKIEVHAADDAKVEARVLVIETNIKSEEKQAMKRGAWAGILAAVGLEVLWQSVRGLFLKP